MGLASIGARGFAANLDLQPELLKVPNGGIQPQIVMDRDRILHLLYFLGDARQGDLFYVRSIDEGRTFSNAIRVNSQSGSAIAAGTIRGGQIAVGRGGRVHVAWNGSHIANPKASVNRESGKPGEPMLYSRLSDSGKDFEPQRNLMTRTNGLDGGGTIAADQTGGVFVAWHGRGPDAIEGEGARQVFLARSTDDGNSFDVESPVWSRATGACGCCGMRIFADRQGTLHLMFRSATEGIHRDVYLLSAAKGGKEFNGGILHRWDINACPMSSMSFCETKAEVLASWETNGQVYFAPVDGPTAIPRKVVAASAEPSKRKHSFLAANSKGQTMLIWIEGSGWQKGGVLTWRVFDSKGNPISEVVAAGPSPTWSFGAVFARKNGSFVIFT